jgi:hypothetical protein
VVGIESDTTTDHKRRVDGARAESDENPVAWQDARGVRPRVAHVRGCKAAMRARALVSMIFVVGCGGSKETSSSTTETSKPPAAETPAPSTAGSKVGAIDGNWRDFVSKPGRFIASFPGAPVEEERARGRRKTEVRTVREGPDLTYSVDYLDLPGTPTAKDRAEVFDGMANDPDIKVLKTEEIKLDDHPGRAMTLEVTEEKLRATAYMRVYFVESRMYMLFASHDADKEKFFSSFRLTK